MAQWVEDRGYRIIAEGVETTEIIQRLVEWGCDELKEYLLSKPLCVEWLSSDRSCQTRQVVPSPNMLAHHHDLQLERRLSLIVSHGVV